MNVEVSLDRTKIARLSAGQIACLTLVNQHFTSKDIARRLSISPHTVDQRLKTACRILNVSSRAQAARLVAAAQADDATYQSAVYQQPDLVTANQSTATLPHNANGAALNLDDHHVVRDCGGEFEFEPQSVQTDDYPRQVPFEWRGSNDLTTGQRIAVILVMAAIIALSFGMLIAGLEALSNLFD